MCLYITYAGIRERSAAEPDKQNLLEKEDADGWNLILVNKWYPISSDSRIETRKLSNGISIDKRIYEHLQKMFEDAKKEGIHLLAASGYRTEKEQEELYNDRLQAYIQEGYSLEDAKKETERWVALPNQSEHQTGLAVDINGDLETTDTEAYEWLEKNAYLYGFIYRYPADKTSLTGVANEPWHYRYVGVNAATSIYKSGICFEEYHKQLVF